MAKKAKPKVERPPEVFMMDFGPSYYPMPKAFRQRQEALRSLSGLIGRNLKGKKETPNAKG